jgi:peptidoglycan/LPS O-acetylase OafA/YrhL
LESDYVPDLVRTVDEIKGMIKNLQVLRAIAALLVVFFHCDFLNLKIGQFGVDIFFVISGFIISFILNKKQENFLVKRFIRVVPMYYLFTILVIVVWAVYPEAFASVYISYSSVIKSLLFIPYVVGNSGPILSLGWSLNYEMFFYVTVGLFLILFKKPGKALLFSAALMFLLVLIRLIHSPSNSLMMFYGHEIVIEFIFGIAIYHIVNMFQALFENKKIIFVFGLLAVVSFVVMGYFDYQKIYFSRTLLFGVPSFFVVLFFIISENLLDTENPIHKYFYQIGNASYVVYLVHPFIIFFIARLISPIFGVGLFNSVIELLIKLSLVVLISNWIHKKIELPVVRSFEKLFHLH